MSRISIQELSAVFVEKYSMSRAEAQRFVTTFFSLIQTGLERDNLVKINGLGTFKLIGVDDRESVNVNTGERVVIEGHQKIGFQPDSLIKEMVNKPFSGFETVVVNEGVVFDEISGVPDDGDDDEPEEGFMEEVEDEPEAPEVPETPEAPEAPEAPEEPEAPEAPKEHEEQPKPEMSRLQVMPEETEYMEERRKWPLWAAAIVACIVSFGIGYWLGTQQTQLEVEDAIVAENTVVNMESDTIAKAVADKKAEKPAQETAKPQKPAEEAAKHAAAEEKKPEEAAKPAAADEKKPAQAAGLDKYEAMDARIRTGAYRIVGTQTTVKVRPGMTIKKIARQQIGEELACYIAAYNDMKENDSLTVGQEIKIPKLEWKKKSKAKDNKQ